MADHFNRHSTPYFLQKFFTFSGIDQATSTDSTLLLSSGKPFSAHSRALYRFYCLSLFPCDFAGGANLLRLQKTFPSTLISSSASCMNSCRLNSVK